MSRSETAAATIWARSVAACWQQKTAAVLRSESAAAGGWAEEPAAQAGADPHQRDSVWSGVRRSIDSLADPRVLDALSPQPWTASSSPSSSLREHGTVYLLGSTGAQLSVAPLITALLEDLLNTARVLAAGSADGRLDPPLLLLLDEAANIASIPSLPNLLADGGGTGITTVAVLQSLAQARARWGDAGADSMWDTTTPLTSSSAVFACTRRTRTRSSP